VGLTPYTARVSRFNEKYGKLNKNANENTF